MNYLRHYDALVQRANTRTLDGYVERHHITPRCMGGGDEPGNIAALTPEEHFVAHQLLVKIYPGNKKLVYAVWAMTHGSRRSNKKYGWLKRKRSEAQLGTTHTDETKKKISLAAKGRRLSERAKEILHQSRRGSRNSDEHNRKVSAALSGKKKSEEHVAAIRESRKNIVYTPELREKLAANRGKKLNDNQRAALLLANKGRPLRPEHAAKLRVPKGPQVLTMCPHCSKSGGISLMKRWHFDNCKVATP